MKDTATPLLPHDRESSPGHIDYAIKVGVNHGFESFRAQLLEWRNVAVAGIIHDDIQTPERADGALHCGFGRVLVFEYFGAS